MRIVLLAAIMVMATNVTVAQKKLTFRSQNFVGILGGENEGALQLTTINGFQRKLWFAGVGTGLDFYYQRTIPLFASFSRYFSSRPNSFYVSADGGTNFLWDKSTGNMFNGGTNNGKFRPSLYYGAYAGYKFGVVKNKGSLMFNIGYSGKQIREEVSIPVPCVNPPCPETDQHLKYDLKRISVRMGWMF
jgi:hypothetical protein